MLCGSPEMVRYTKAAFERAPKPPESIEFEEYADVPVTTATTEPTPAQGETS